MTDIKEVENPAGGSTPPEPKIVKPQTLVESAKNIRRAFDGDPKYERSFDAKQQQAKVLLEGWMHGEVTLDQAAEAIAAREVELEMALDTDSLMDLPNKDAIEAFMEEQIALARRNGSTISLGFIDLDDFGDINKRYEEEAGNATLEAVGVFIKSELNRPTDKAGRRGGEELVIVMPNTLEEGATHVLEGMTRRMSENIAALVKDIGGYEFDRDITMSSGVVSFSIPNEDPRDDRDIMIDLINIADRRMRLAKKHGKNRVINSATEKEIAQDNG